MSEKGTCLPRAVDLRGAIAAFERLSREASAAHDPNCFAGLFLAQTADLLREVQAGRIVDETEWLESLEAARQVAEICGGGLHV